MQIHKLKPSRKARSGAPLLPVAALALTAVAAGFCPTAKLSLQDCGPSAVANCNLEIEWPSGAQSQSYPCVSVTTTDNRKKGLCTSPHDNTKWCYEDSGGVVTTYVRYRVINDAQGHCVQCSSDPIATTTVTNDCPTTYQGTSEDPSCKGS
jgi:hypothetical protein